MVSVFMLSITTQRLTLSLFGSKGIDTYKIKLLSILGEGKVGIIDNLSGINQVLRFSVSYPHISCIRRAIFSNRGTIYR